MQKYEFWGRKRPSWSPQWETGSYITFHRTLKTLFYIYPLYRWEHCKSKSYAIPPRVAQSVTDRAGRVQDLSFPPPQCDAEQLTLVFVLHLRNSNKRCPPSHPNTTARLRTGNEMCKTKLQAEGFP